MSGRPCYLQGHWCAASGVVDLLVEGKVSDGDLIMVSLSCPSVGHRADYNDSSGLQQVVAIAAATKHTLGTDLVKALVLFGLSSVLQQNSYADVDGEIDDFGAQFLHADAELSVSLCASILNSCANHILLAFAAECYVAAVALLTRIVHGIVCHTVVQHKTW